MCVAVALGLIGTAVSAAGAIAQGNAAAAAAEAQARAYEQQAGADQQASAYEAERERFKQKMMTGSAIAQVGASGVGLAGSPTEVIAMNAREGELDLATIRYGSLLRQNNLRTQADISRFSGKQAKKAGAINAFSSVIGGLSSTYQNSVQMGTTSSIFR